MSKTPLFGCQIPECASEVSYPANMLRNHPENGQPICGYCFDNVRPANSAGFDELEPFVPDYQKRIEELEAAQERVECGKCKHRSDRYTTRFIGGGGDYHCREYKQLAMAARLGECDNGRGGERRKDDE